VRDDMKIDSIVNGIVLDHIAAGNSLRIYKFLNLDDLECSVAVIRNCRSKKYGKKDVIKIDSIIDMNLDVLGYIDPNITVNIIRDGKIAEKKHLELPERLVNVIKCHNPRCITSIEQEVDHIFKLTDRENIIYRCAYCETKSDKEEIW
jgi:aspartate carbamoyltransferase regulatory subunit